MVDVLSVFYKKIALLDLGGVVFQSTGDSNSTINWSVISELNHKYGDELNIGKDRFADFLKDYNLRTQQSLGGRVFLKSLFDTLEINQELIDLLGENHDIIIVSDHYREAIEYISGRCAFGTWAVQQIYSFDYGVLKSNPLFFKRLLEELEYEKEEMIFIDDSPNKLESARVNGIEGILFRSNEQVRVDLESRN